MENPRIANYAWKLCVQYDRVRGMWKIRLPGKQEMIQRIKIRRKVRINVFE